MTTRFRAVLCAGLALLASPEVDAGRWDPILIPAARRSRARRKKTPPADRPTATLPRRWDLPEGWNTLVRPLPSGGTVEYLSGSDARYWARLYTWPAERIFDGAQEARTRLVAEFDQKVMQGRVLHRRDQIRQILWGWSSEPQEGDPDILIKARSTRVGDRLVAVVAGTTKPEDSSARPMEELEALLDRCIWEKPPRVPWGLGGL